MKQLFFIWVLSFMWLQGCREEEQPLLAPDELFPLQKGFYQEYSVTEIRYSAFNPPETLEYELRYEIIDSIVTGEKTTYVIHRSKRSSAAASWMYVDSWSAYRTRQHAVVTEGNTAFVKLIFPLTPSARWNGNLFNSLDPDEYAIEIIDDRCELNPDLILDTCLTVRQSMERSLLAVDDREERYARHAGLIFKESNVIQYNTSGGVPGSQIIGGFYLRMVLISYGKN